MFTNPPNRHPVLSALRVNIPQMPTVDKAIADIASRREIINLAFQVITSEDIRRLAQAFATVENGSTIKRLVLSSCFTTKQENRFPDLVILWEAVKYKIRELKLDQNTIPPSFYILVSEQKKSDPHISVATIDFSMCESPMLSSVQTPTAVSSPAPREVRAGNYLMEGGAAVIPSPNECKQGAGIPRLPTPPSFLDRQSSRSRTIPSEKSEIVSEGRAKRSLSTGIS